MTAQSVQAITLVFADPDDSNQRGSTQFNRVNSSLSYTYLASSNIRTLSTNSATAGTDVTGLLYTPDLPAGDACIDASAPYVPANVTRRASLPDTDFDLIAVAPWISPPCTLAYLQAASDDPVRGFLFFPPDNSTTEPPPGNDPTWNLGDGGHWKTNNRYPVYVIPGQDGQQLLRESALYSGNMTDVPNGHELTEIYDPREYVRLFVDIDTGSGSTLPSLWVFLLIVLAILLAVIGATSVLMHWLQRRRRQQLRRRVANGEVDLEALGIKRLTVPQELLDKMPLYTYGTGAPVRPSEANRPLPAAPAKSLDSLSSSRPGSPASNVRPTPALNRHSSYHPTAFQQPTCAICLDDFVAPDPTNNEEGTIVRELNCRHIYHPECIDSFLRDNSSLCPMCKKSALPIGYCPKNVTNAMVRRERMVRRIRETVPAEVEVENSGEAAAPQSQTFAQRIRNSGTLFPLSTSMPGRRITSAPPSTPAPPASEMQDLSSPTLPPASAAAGSRRSVTTPLNAPAPPQSQPRNSERRREWARQRAVSMLGRQAAPIDPEADEAARTSGWRKALRGVFPALGGGGRSQ